MELLVIIAALLLLDILAMRFGVDSRILDAREDAREQRGWWPDLITGDALRDFAWSHQAQLHVDAHAERLAGLAAFARPRPALRVRLAHALRALALLIEPGHRPNDVSPRTTGSTHLLVNHRY